MRRLLPELLAVILGGFLVLAAVGRQVELAAIAPGDLAAFHQATFNAAHGRGFAQTALSFEGQSLIGSVHFSPIRALWVLPYRLRPALSTLVALQGLAAALALWLTARVARAAGASTATAATVVAIVGLSPLTAGVATADLRPLAFVLPGVIAVGLGLIRPSLPTVLLGGAFVIACREEAPWLLAALLPLGVAATRRHRRLLPLLVLAALCVASVALLLAVWGRLSVLSTNDAPAAALDAILHGRRPLFRDTAEAGSGLRDLLGLLPALAAPLASLPGVAAWLWLAVFSVFEPAQPGQPGAHYLAVAQPLLALGVALGLPRLARRLPLHPLLATALLAALLTGLPELRDGLRFAAHALVGPSPSVSDTLDLMAEVQHSDGGVLCEPRLGPLLADREHLYLRGNFALEPGLADRILPTLDYALLASTPQGAPPTDAWPALLRDAGFQPVQATDGTVLWTRPLSPPAAG